MKKLISIFLSLILFVCCSYGNLSRDQAKKQIIEDIKKDDNLNKVTVTFSINSFTGNIDHSYKREMAENLANQGYFLQLRGGISPEYELTDKIQPFTKVLGDNWNGYYVEIELAEMHDIIITGITGSDDYMRVEFDILYKLNEVSMDISYLDINTKSGLYKNFKKYDDGWRLVK